MDKRPKETARGKQSDAEIAGILLFPTFLFPMQFFAKRISNSLLQKYPRVRIGFLFAYIRSK
jgi:hypothetical protein